MRMIGPAALMAALFMAVAAWAHGPAQWIQDGGFKRDNGSTPCCNEHDGKPMPPGAVKATAAGYLIVSTGEVIPYDWRALHPSIDNQFWSCATTRTWCLFVPPAGS